MLMQSHQATLPLWLNRRVGSSECISPHLSVEATWISSSVLHSVLCLQPGSRHSSKTGGTPESSGWSGCAPADVEIGWTVLLLTQIYGTFRLAVIL